MNDANFLLVYMIFAILEYLVQLAQVGHCWQALKSKTIANMHWAGLITNLHFLLIK